MKERKEEEKERRKVRLYVCLGAIKLANIGGGN
jgi:hypothetical protein